MLRIKGKKEPLYGDNKNSDMLALWTQVQITDNRLMEAIYRFLNSDRRLSVWTPCEFDKGDVFPEKSVFYSWARYKNKIYRYGGRSLFEGSIESGWVCKEQFWAFELESFKWEKIKYSGPSPGARYGHVSVVHKNYFYV